MDKFGIFKLLNSFLSPSTSSNSGSEKENSTGSDILTNLLSSLSSNKSDKTSPPPTQKPPAKPSAPLQSGMLYTMNSHDEFIKRVKSKHLQK